MSRSARTALLLAALLGGAVALAHDAAACAGPVRCVPPPDRAAPAGRIMFGTLGSVARMLPAQAYGVDSAGRPVTAFAQTGDGRLRIVAVRWTAAGAVDTSFGTGDSGPGVAQLFVDLPGEAQADTPRVAGTSDGGLLVAVPLRGTATQRRIALLSLDGAGRLDPAFGTGGIALLDGMHLAAAPQELADGAIAVTGATVASPGRLVVLTARGAPDPGFGQGGAVTLPALATVLAPAGDGLLVGLRTPAAEVRILRLLRNGRPDERAGPDGLQTAAVAGGDATVPATLRVAADGSATVAGSVQRPAPGNPSAEPGTASRFVARFAAAGSGAAASVPTDGATAVDAAGRILIAVGERTIRRYAADGRLDRSFGRSGSAIARLPRTVSRNPTALAVLPDGTIVAGGPGAWGSTPLATFQRLHADGTRDTSFGPRLLTLRQTSARLGAHNVIRLRVHCAEDAQRRCVVRMRAGAQAIRAFVAPGGDRRIPVRVGKTAARRIKARGRAIVRVRFSVIDEAVRVEVLDAPIVVRRR